MDTNPFVTADTAPVPPEPPGGAVPAVAGYAGLELVGRGGMGKVYRARHATLGRTVALKVLAHEPDDRALARFAEEARAVALLHHPNICPLFETGTVDGRPWFAQEFLDGGTLARKFNGEPQDPAAAAALLETLAEAIHHSHEQGILHRDLKPSNILLAADGTPKVTDFGLAKALAAPGADLTTEPGGGLTRTGEIVGTPAYMPPEQASGVVSGLGPATDVYALGAILYEALTGRPPFQAPDALQTLFMVLARDPVPPRVLQPKVPRDLETICLKCLEKSPKKRYATAQELAADLARFREGRPILARPVGFWERTTKSARRNKAAAALVALSVLFVLLVAAFGVAQALANGRLSAAKNNLETINERLVEAKGDLEAANDGLRKANAESDLSYALAVEALESIIQRFANRLFGVPLVERVMLETADDAARLYERLAALRPADRRLAARYVMALVGKASQERAYGKPEAERSLARASDYLAARLKEAPDDETLRHADVRLGVESVNAREAGVGTADLAALRKSLVERIDAFRRDFPSHAEADNLAVHRHLTAANIAEAAHDDDGRLDHRRKAAEAARRFRQRQPGNPAAAVQLHNALYMLGAAYEMRRENPEAEEAYQELERRLADAHALRPDDPQLKGELADAKEARANVVAKLGDIPAAGALYRETEPTRRELAKLFPLDPFRRYYLARNLAEQARLDRTADPERAKKNLEEAVAVAGKLARDFPREVIFTSQNETWREWLRILVGDGK